MNSVSPKNHVYGDEVASRMGVSVSAAMGWAKMGRIPPYEVVNRVAVWNAADLQAYFANPDRWREQNQCADKNPARRVAPLNEKRRCRAALITAALAALRTGPQTTADLHGLLGCYAPDLIYALRKQGHRIKTTLVRATDAEGNPHFNMARYELLEGGRHE